MDEEEKSMEAPSDLDGNESEAAGVVKSKGRRKKTREERSADRKVVMVIFALVIAVTGGFWLWPRLEKIRWGWAKKSVDGGVPPIKPEVRWKNYVEYEL